VQTAAFEWARSELVDAADSPVADIAAVAARAPQQWGAMRPRPIAAHRRLDLAADLPRLWQALDAGGSPPAPEWSAPPVPWLLWRKRLAIHWRSIDDDEAWALAACTAGASFAELCEGLHARLGGQAAPLRAAALLRQWLHDELLTSL